MIECDKLNSHTNSKLHVICISSNNDRHLVTKTFTPLLFTSLVDTLFRISHSFKFFWFYFFTIIYTRYGCMFCMLLLNFVNCIILLLCLCIPIVMYIPFQVFSFIVLLCVWFVCKCVLYYCHRVSTQLKLTHIYHIVSYHIISYQS